MDTQKNIGEPKMSAAPAASKGGGGGRKESGAAAATSPSQQGAQRGEQGAAASNQGATQGGATEGATGGQTGGQDLLQQAKQTTGEIVNQVQERAGSQISQQKESAATELTTIVNAVRRFGESLTGEETGPIARYAAQYGDKAAENLERLSSYIREKDPKELLNDMQNFGRRRPAWLLGGAFILGFAGARLIKSSMDAASQHEFHSNTMRPNMPGTTTPSVPAPRPSSPTPNIR